MRHLMCIFDHTIIAVLPQLLKVTDSIFSQLRKRDIALHGEHALFSTFSAD